MALNIYSKVISFILFTIVISSFSLAQKTKERAEKLPYKVEYIDESKNEYEGNIVVHLKSKNPQVNVTIFSIDGKEISSMQMKNSIVVFYVEQPSIKVVIKNDRKILFEDLIAIPKGKYCHLIEK